MDRVRMIRKANRALISLEEEILASYDQRHHEQIADYLRWLIWNGRAVTECQVVKNVLIFVETIENFEAKEREKSEREGKAP